MAFWRTYDRIETALALLALVGVVLAVLAAGIGRSIGAPIATAPQYAQLFLIWACMLGADVAVRRGEHIRVTALPDILPPAARKLLALISFVLILPFLGFVAIEGWKLALGNWERELGASGLSYGLVTLALPVGAVLLAVSFLRRLPQTGLLRLFEPDKGDQVDPGTGAHHTAEDLL